MQTPNPGLLRHARKQAYLEGQMQSSNYPDQLSSSKWIILITESRLLYYLKYHYLAVTRKEIIEAGSILIQGRRQPSQ